METGQHPRRPETNAEWISRVADEMSRMPPERLFKIMVAAKLTTPEAAERALARIRLEEQGTR